MNTPPPCIGPLLSKEPETGKTIKIFSGFLSRLPFRLSRLCQPLPRLLQLVRVRPVDQPLHLLRRRLLPVRQLEEHIEQDRPQRHQFSHERLGLSSTRPGRFGLLAAPEHHLPAPLAERAASS